MPRPSLRAAVRPLACAPAALFVILLFASGTCLGGTFTGVFGQDDEQAQFLLTVPAASTVTMQTTSFANGGFAPVLSLFDAGGTQDELALDAGGTAPLNCGARSIDPGSGFCLDGYLQLPLNAGSYLLILTEEDNTPLGSTLPDGFLRQGQGNFTGPEFLGTPGAFVLFDGSQRTASWSLTIDGADATAVSATPEPALAPVVLCALLGLLCKRLTMTSRTGVSR